MRRTVGPRGGNEDGREGIFADNTGQEDVGVIRMIVLPEDAGRGKADGARLFARVVRIHTEILGIVRGDAVVHGHDEMVVSSGGRALLFPFASIVAKAPQRQEIVTRLARTQPCVGFMQRVLVFVAIAANRAVLHVLLACASRHVDGYEEPAQCTCRHRPSVA